MEFRYRAGDRPPTSTDAASTQSPNPNSSFLSGRPIPGLSEDHLREAIQREIEKEQIRLEIIAAETARRRELIAEVAQEMAIETSETGMSLDDKLTMWITQRKLLSNQNLDNNNNNLFRQKCTYSDPLMQLPPLQQIPEATPVLESNKDKLIVLKRPDSIGAKRKAEDTQTGLEIAKDGVSLARDPHLLGPKKKAKETAFKAKPISVQTGETVSSKLLPCLVKLGNEKQIKSSPKPKFKFWCDICGVGAFSQTVMRNHELGKKHIAAIKQQTIIITPPASVAAPQSEDITVLENVTNVQDHQKVEVKETGKKKKTVSLWCEICKVWTCSEQAMETHRLGKKHKALLEKHQRKPLAFLDTNLITVPVRYLNDPGDKEVIVIEDDD